MEFFQRHADDEAQRTVPAEVFLVSCPTEVAAKLVDILQTVAASPPPAFAGGGFWEVMHGDMKGFYKVSRDLGHKRHYRLFCVLERNGASVGLTGPSVIVLCGAEKPFGTAFSDAEYKTVKALRAEFEKRNPRSVKR